MKETLSLKNNEVYIQMKSYSTILTFYDAMI